MSNHETPDENSVDQGEAEIAQRLRDEPMELAYLVIKRDSLFYDRRHTWVTFDPTRPSPWLIAKRETTQAGIRSTSRLDVEKLHKGSGHDDGDLVRTAFVPIEETPIPHHDAPLVKIACPNCPTETGFTVKKTVAKRTRDCEVCGKEVTPIVQ